MHDPAKLMKYLVATLGRMSELSAAVRAGDSECQEIAVEAEKWIKHVRKMFDIGYVTGNTMEEAALELIRIHPGYKLTVEDTVPESLQPEFKMALERLIASGAVVVRDERFYLVSGDKPS